MGSFAADVASVAVAGAGTCGALYLLRQFRDRMPHDVANARSLHEGSVPRIGGVAMWAGGAMAGVWPILSGREAGVLPVIMLAAAGLAIMSFLDDSRGLGTLPRLLGHFAAAGSVAWLMPVPPSVAAGIVLTLVWMTNLYNFMDGADGLAGGMTLVGFTAYGAAAASAPLSILVLLCFATAATAAGFLVFNFHPARVFMGDAGSIPLGFLAGALGVLGWSQGNWPLWFPFLVFSPFIIDATLTLLRRAWRRERVWQAHHEHYYQRLVRMGWGHRRTALAEYGLMLATSASALILLSLSPPLQALGLVLWATIYAGLAWRVDRAWIAVQQR
jgi:UDP-N-acetylmuramyl pentapeptide phosphotransferase/UDP-N-acetylglucosamine-1-phosphate transferase